MYTAREVCRLLGDNIVPELSETMYNYQKEVSTRYFGTGFCLHAEGPWWWDSIVPLGVSS